MMLSKCYTQNVSKFGEIAVAKGLEKFSFIPKKGNNKACSNYCTILLTSHTSNVMLKILQPRFSRMEVFQMYKLDLEKAEKPEIELPTSTG